MKNKVFVRLIIDAESEDEAKNIANNIVRSDSKEFINTEKYDKFENCFSIELKADIDAHALCQKLGGIDDVVDDELIYNRIIGRKCQHSELRWALFGPNENAS